MWVDGTLYFTEIAGGAVSRWTAAGGVERVADDGRRAERRGRRRRRRAVRDAERRDDAGPRGSRPASNASALDGDVTMVATEVAGLTLDGPNDLAFGPDGRLWFTDPRGTADPADNDRPGRLFALDPSTGDGELVIELGPVFPNGIAFLADGTLVWTESFTPPRDAARRRPPGDRHRATRAARSRRALRRRRRHVVRRHRRTPTASASSPAARSSIATSAATGWPRTAASAAPISTSPSPAEARCGGTRSASRGCRCGPEPADTRNRSERTWVA